MKLFKVGDRVRPIGNGEDQSGKVLYWTRLNGTVRAVWNDCGEQRVEIRWDRKAPYGNRVPAYLIALIQ
jgi:hypothetical protein